MRRARVRSKSSDVERLTKLRARSDERNALRIDPARKMASAKDPKDTSSTRGGTRGDTRDSVDPKFTFSAVSKEAGAPSKVRFYELSRAVQERFVASTRGAAAPSPILFRRASRVRLLVWIAAAVVLGAALKLAPRVVGGVAEAVLALLGARRRLEPLRGRRQGHADKVDEVARDHQPPPIARRRRLAVMGEQPDQVAIDRPRPLRVLCRRGPRQVMAEVDIREHDQALARRRAPRSGFRKHGLLTAGRTGSGAALLMR